jgi:phage tail sheath protein FI
MPEPRNYPGVYIEEIPGTVRPIAPASTSVTAFVGRMVGGPVNQPVPLASFADYERVFSGLEQSSPLSFAVRDFFLNGGTQAVVLRLGSSDAPLTGSDLVPVNGAAEQCGIFALDKVESFNLLCIPPGVEPGALLPVAGYCARRRALLLVDAPGSWNAPAGLRTLLSDPLQALAHDAGLPSDLARNVALYFPRLSYPDPLSAQVESFPACGAVAGVMARTDATRGVWKAPAGLDATLVGVKGFALSLTNEEIGQLSAAGINCLRTLAPTGPVIWGARTLAGREGSGDEFRYVPVRRLALFLEQSLESGTRWAVFEPNDETLWARLRQSVGLFLDNLFRQGAFQGTTPEAAYFVRCDQTTTTPADIEQGVVNIVVGFAPLKPAEFVVLQIQQLCGQQPPADATRH